jgi:hypothetical protein
MLQFKTSNNQPVSQSFNLKNAGNIDMKLLLGVIEFQDHFTMDPSQLTIQPGRETTVTASFLPTCTGPRWFELPIAQTDFDNPFEFEPAKFYCIIISKIS